MALEDEQLSYAAYLNAWMHSPGDPELLEDLQKAKAALEVAWLERWAGGAAGVEREARRRPTKSNPIKGDKIIMSKLRLPTWATVGLSVLFGVGEAVNLSLLGFPPVWQTLLSVFLAAGATLVVAPLTGPALQNALHLPVAAAYALAGAFGTATVAVTAASIDPTLKKVLAAVLTAVAGVLVGPGVASTPSPAPVPPAPVPPPAPPAPAA